MLAGSHSIGCLVTPGEVPARRNERVEATVPTMSAGRLTLPVSAGTSHAATISPRDHELIELQGRRCASRREGS